MSVYQLQSYLYDIKAFVCLIDKKLIKNDMYNTNVCVFYLLALVIHIHTSHYIRIHRNTDKLKKGTFKLRGTKLITKSYGI